jgi:hypothetical protein
MAPAKTQPTDLRPGEITLRQAAQILGVSAQRARQLAEQLGARIVCYEPRYAILKSAVLHYGATRETPRRQPDVAPSANLMTVRQVAEALGVTTTRVYRMDSVLSPTIVPRGDHQISRYYDRQVVEAYARRRIGK